MPTLQLANRNVAVVERRSAEDSSMDITVTLWTADHDGNTAITHPITKKMKDDPANSDIVRPIISNARDVIYAGRRPKLKEILHNL